MIDAERLDLVSASRFDILAQCPASESLRRTLPSEAFESDNEYSERGSVIHAAFETGSTFDLDADDLAIYNRAIASEKALVTDWCQDFNIELFEEGPREERMWMHDQTALKPITSAKLDRHYVSLKPAGFVAVSDLKSLWARNLTPAAQNYQGRVQTVVAAEEYGAQHVRMAFNKAMFGSVDFCDYDATALWRAEFSIRQALWEAEQPGAQFRPGDHCQFCACKPYCIRAIKDTKSTLTVINPPAEIVDMKPKQAKEAIAAAVQTAPVELVREMFSKRALVGYVLEAVKTRLAALPPEEKYRLGLRMQMGRSTDKVRDVKGAFDALIAGGFPEEMIWGCLKLSKTDVVEMVEAFKNVRESEAQVFYENQLDEFIERGRGDEILTEA